jgi:cytoskeletal protein RodZ
MHEDPTRMMRQPEEHKPHGNMRLIVAGLVAVIVGLLVAVVVIAGSGGSDKTVTATPSETSSTTETTTGSTTTGSTTTGSTTTETTPTTPTTTTPTNSTPTTTTPPPEEENGSGGIGAP